MHFLLLNKFECHVYSYKQDTELTIICLAYNKTTDTLILDDI